VRCSKGDGRSRPIVLHGGRQSQPGSAGKLRADIVVVTVDGLPEQLRTIHRGGKKHAGWWPVGALLARALAEHHQNDGGAEPFGVVAPRDCSLRRVPGSVRSLWSFARLIGKTVVSSDFTLLLTVKNQTIRVGSSRSSSERSIRAGSTDGTRGAPSSAFVCLWESGGGSPR
jgi:hypothetical protein